MAKYSGENEADTGGRQGGTVKQKADNLDWDYLNKKMFIVSMVSFIPSFTRYFLTGNWHFGGIDIASLPEHSSESQSFLNWHVVGALLWTFCAFYQVATRGRNNHKIVGRVAVLTGISMLIPIIWTNDPQIKSCWPIYGYHWDFIMVLPNVVGIVKNLVMGTYYMRKGIKFKANHKLYMYEAIESSLVPAVMRWLTFLQIATWIPAYRLLQGSTVFKMQLSAGEWFLVKEITYVLLISYANRELLKHVWNAPSVRIAKGDIVRLAAVIAVASRVVAYILLIGFDGQSCVDYELK